MSQTARLFGMSNAYAQAADVLTQALVAGDYDADFHNTRVVLHLCHHALELFLKGAIQVRSGLQARSSHRLDRLLKEYRLLYPEEHFVFDTPFGRELLDSDGGLFPETLTPIQELHDQRYRYPTDRAGRPFFDAEPFDVAKYAEAIQEFRFQINIRAAAIDMSFSDEFWVKFGRRGPSK
ncbi:hypothetical protein APR51_44770 [Variovorax paradoxus]|nr:hypothetical protein APR51_44770 [Variovorax paradoxus]